MQASGRDAHGPRTASSVPHTGERHPFHCRSPSHGIAARSASRNGMIDAMTAIIPLRASAVTR
jgi:hypothetical protein